MAELMDFDGSSRSRVKMAQGTLKRGPWTKEEDEILKKHVRVHGARNWKTCLTLSGLMRCGKSCRFRWLNQLKPNIKKGAFSVEEEAKIVDLHAKVGSKWSLIARQLPRRTDNEIKNFWNTRLKKRQRALLPIYPNQANEPVVNHNHQESNPLPSAVKTLTPCSPSVVSIYDIFDSWSSRRTAIHNNSYISEPSRNLIYQNNAGLFAPISTPSAFGNIGTGGYLSGTPNEADDHYAYLGLLGDSSFIREGTRNGIKNASSSLVDVATAAGSHVYTSIGKNIAAAAPAPREANQVANDYLSLLRTPPSTVSMNEWFNKEETIAPNNEHTPSYGGW